ncbi:hypothetical protein WMO79_17360 [Micrococcaceae bacterium Sec7.4]
MTLSDGTKDETGPVREDGILSLADVTTLREFAEERRQDSENGAGKPKLAGAEIAALSIFGFVTAALWIAVLFQAISLGTIVITAVGTGLIAIGGVGQIFANTSPLPRRGSGRKWRSTVNTFSGMAIAIGGLLLSTDAFHDAFVTDWGTKPQ